MRFFKEPEATKKFRRSCGLGQDVGNAGNLSDIWFGIFWKSTKKNKKRMSTSTGGSWGYVEIFSGAVLIKDLAFGEENCGKVLKIT
jgi:hypothetical protein